jgi:hypothetical protein
MRMTEEEFDRLAKRYELAHAHIRHESEQMNQRTNRLFGIQAGLMAAYGLTTVRVLPVNASAAVYLMCAIAALGVFLIVALINEVKAGTQAATDVQRWWEQQAGLSRDTSAKLAFPPLQLQLGDKALPYDPRLNQKYFNLTKASLVIFWGFSFLYPFSLLDHSETTSPQSAPESQSLDVQPELRTGVTPANGRSESDPAPSETGSANEATDSSSDIPPSVASEEDK